MDKTHDTVVITGLGPVTSVGVGCDELWSALAAGRTNVQRRGLTVDAGKVEELPLAAMPPVDQVRGLHRHMEFLSAQGCEGYRDLGYSLLAMELALADAKLEYDREDNSIGLVQAFEAPGVEGTVGRLFEMLSGPPPTDGPPPVYEMLARSFYAMQPFLFVHLAGKAFGLRGFSTSVHNACTSGAFAIEVAARQIRSRQTDVMVVVGGEAFETGVRLEWFRRLGMYANESTDMRPFDTESSGFYAGEGAGAIVLESGSHAKRRGASVCAEYAGGGFAHQAWKQTVPDVRSARLRDVIIQACRRSGIALSDVDLVIPHGAGTQLSDGYEATCLAQAIERGEAADGNHKADTVATVFKPYVGHMLAGNGIIETVCALLAMTQGTVPVTPNSSPDRIRLPVPLVTTPLARNIDTVLKLSTGFTGHDAASIFRRVSQA